jgi:hypothetical protein
VGGDIVSDRRLNELRKRTIRWRYGRIMIVLVYIGVLLDITTTDVAVHAVGMKFEQNPLAVDLINHIGWEGLYLLATGLCAVCYISVKAVYWRMALAWSLLLNVVLTIMLTVRVLAVVTTILYLVQPAAAR